jgi:Uma2 family endonuclease
MRGARRLGKGIARAAARWHFMRMTEALAHRFTTEEYHILSDKGILEPGARVELLDGLILDMCPVGSSHDDVLSWLAKTLVRARHGRYLASVRKALHLSALYEPQPDLMLLRPVAHEYKAVLPEAADVLLLIEVADESLTFDRTRKLPAYAARRIPEVWIVNIPCLMIEVYREPDGLSYLQRKAVAPGNEVRCEAFPDLVVRIAELFASSAA